MLISIVTLANLGKKTNLKTAGILPVIKTLQNHRELGQVICQINTDFGYLKTKEAIPRVMRYAVNSFARFFRIPIKNFYNNIFDHFASKKIGPADIIIFHPARFTKSVKKSKSLGAITVGIATVAHPEFDLEIHKAECNKFGAEFKGVNFNILKEAVNKMDYIIAYSDFVKETYISKGFSSEKIFVAYSDAFIPEKIESLNKKSNLFRFLYVGYTNPRKGLHYLLKAWQDINFQNAELVLVGGYSNEMPKKMRKYCDEIIKDSSNIKWVGSVKNATDYYREADAFILPSLSEGNPKVVMEAMGYGLPVIVTKGSKGLVIDKESGFVVNPGDTEALKEKILWFYNNRNDAKNMGSMGRKIIENKKPFGLAVREICQKIIK